MSPSLTLSEPKERPSYTHQFRWDSSVPDSVAVKGSFDGWSNPLPLAKERSGKFGAQIELEWGAKITYKYVVDGHWRHNPNEPTEPDPDGNINNVFYVPAPPQTLADPTSLPASSSDLISSPQEPHSTVILPASPTHPPPPLPLPDMSPPFPVIFPTTSPPSTPPIASPANPTGRRAISLAPRPPPLRPHRTTSQHAHSLLAAAPRTPGDKAPPAGASVSTVVSAMAGVAATAIPAAILAVTGKDILRAPSPTEDTAALSSPSAPHSATSPRPPGTLLLQSDSTQGPPLKSPTLHQEPGQSLPDPPRAPLMPVNDPADTVENPPEPLSTHIALPPSDSTQNSNTDAPQAHAAMLPAGVLAGVLGREQGSETSGAAVEASTIVVAHEEPPQGGEPLPAQAGTGGKENAEQADEVNTSGKAVGGEAEQSVKQTTGQAEQVETSVEQASVAADTSLKSAAPASGEPASQITPTIVPQLPSPEVSKPSVGGLGAEVPSVTVRPGENLVRKTSGWRYSVGSIRSRRVSGENDRSGGEGSSSSSCRRKDGASGEAGAGGSETGGSPRRRKGSIFQKIKAVLSPHRHSSLGNQSLTPKHQEGSSGTGTRSVSGNHHQKDKKSDGLPRTATIGR